MLVWLIRVVENYHELIWVLHDSMEDIRPVKESKAWWQNVRRELALKTRSYAARLRSDQIKTLLFPTPQNFSKKRPGEPSGFVKFPWAYIGTLLGSFLAQEPFLWCLSSSSTEVTMACEEAQRHQDLYSCCDSVAKVSSELDAHKGWCFFLNGFIQSRVFWKLVLFGSLNFTKS